MRKTRDKSAGRYWLGRLRAGTLLVQFCRPALLDSLVEWGPSAPVGRENQVWHALATFASDRLGASIGFWILRATACTCRVPRRS